MKKLLLFTMILCAVLAFTACDIAEELIGDKLPPDLYDTLFPSDDPATEIPDGKDDDPDTGDNDPDTSDKDPNSGDNDPDTGDNDPDSGDTDAPKKTYVSFSETEKNIFTQYIGTVIPFIPNDEYYVEGYYDISDYENGINFYTVGNTEEEFSQYLTLFSDYDLTDTYTDDYGDTWYCYKKDGVTVELAYYYSSYDDVYYVDVYVTAEDEKDDTPPTQGYKYTDFTAEEKALFTSYFGFVIPFLPNNEYYVDDLSISGGSEPTLTLDYYTIGNTEDEFNAYQELFSNYDLTDVYDIEDMVMYTYSRGDVVIYLSYFIYEGDFCVDVCVTVADENPDDGSGTYTDFTDTEKLLFNSYFGFVIPFINNSDYSVEEYTYEDEVGLNFYTFGNTRNEFNDYRALLDSTYTFHESYKDSEGDTWYVYTEGKYYIEIAYYEYYNDIYVIDVYVYEIADGSTGTGDSTVNDDLLSNNGAGLPEDPDGVYDLDFTDAEYVKDVTDQGYYLGGCPTTGSPAVLVIPVEFSDSLASSKGYTTDALANAFSKGGKTDYYSVYDYYYISSYGNLTLDITVLDYWFKPQYTSTYYYKATYNYYDEKVAIGDQLILNEALAYLSTVMDLSKFDSDNNGTIDSVVLINTLDVGEEDFYWAYRYWNIYTDSYGFSYEYDGVSAYDYLWASYQFLHETTDVLGNTEYTNKSGMNTYTFIHEFAHVLGLNDYYDTAYVYDPMNGLDVMDAMMGDHNPYSKFNLGWITESRLVVTDSSVTITLEAFAKSGDTIILATNWDDKLGAYQEYYVIMYYTNEGLNSGDAGYFVRDGILVYHVNATLYKEVYEGEIYYDVYNNNTDPSDSYGTEDNLIEYVESELKTYTYTVGDTLPTVTDDNGNTLGYTFIVDELTSDSATLTFTVK